MTELEAHRARLAVLEADKARVEAEISTMRSSISKILCAAYPHKVGDVINVRGRVARVASVSAYGDDVCCTVNYKTPSGTWSKKSSILFDW